jgi:hypothetical protein
MGLQTAAVLYPVNSTTVDSGAGIDIRLLDSAQGGADDDTQTVTATHTQDNVERTFDPATAGVTAVADARAFQGEGWALRLTEDMTPTDDANCNAFLSPLNHVVNIQIAVNQSGGTYTGGTYAPSWRAALIRYNPATDTGTVVATSANNAVSWNYTPATGDLGTFKNLAITFNAAAQYPNGIEFSAGEILLLQIGVNTGTIPNPTLGTATWTYTLRVDNANTNISWASGQGICEVCKTTGSASGGIGNMETSAKDYDGADDYLTRGAGLTGAADGTEGVFSVWFNADTNPGIRYFLQGLTTVGGTTPRVQLGVNTAGRISALARTSGGVNVFFSSSNNTGWTTGVWNHLLMAWNASTLQVYMNDVAATGLATPSGSAIDYTLADWSVCAQADGANKFDGCLSETLFHTSYLDISVEANRRKFITADLKAVNLGSDGSIPFGVQPLIYIKDGQTNVGGGGAFAVHGSLGDCISAPPPHTAALAAASIVLPTVGASAGAGAAAGSLEATKETTGSASGVGAAQGEFVAFKEMVGAAVGVCDAAGFAALVVPTVGAVEIGGGGGSTVTQIFAVLD